MPRKSVNHPLFPRAAIGVATCALSFALVLPTQAGQPTVSQAWIRGTVASQSVTTAYMVIQNDVPTLIIGASSPIADRVELRGMDIADKGPLQASKIDSIRVDAKEPLRLTPVTDHLVLIGLRKPLVAGQRIPITLKYLLPGNKHDEVSFEAEVRPFFAGKN